jgi:hypothetical protein
MYGSTSLSTLGYWYINVIKTQIVIDNSGQRKPLGRSAGEEVCPVNWTP